MKLSLIALIGTLLGLLISNPVGAQDQRLLLCGTMTWKSDNSGASSLKLRVLVNGVEKALTYTDAHGNYGIMDLPGKPEDYTVEIQDNGKVIKTLKPEDLKATARGGRLDIKLDL